MKKISIFLFSIMAFTNVSIAQDDESSDSREDLMFGLKAGANYSNVYDEQGGKFDADPKVGFVGGAFLAIPIGKYLGVQPELLFSQKGFQASGNLLGSTYNVTRTTSFIDIPVFFAFKPSEFISILLGPQYSYLMKQRDVFTSTTTSYAQEKEFSNDDIRKNIMGIVGGLDLTLNHFVLGARMAWDVQTNNANGTSTTPRYKNVWYQGTVGFRF
jgi:Outer membrane protein beta-barrel domain